MDRNDLINIIRKADREMIQEAGFRLAGKPKGTKNKKIDYVEIEADRVPVEELSKTTISSLENKPKRELSEHQRANLEKGRLALMAKWEKLKTERQEKKVKAKPEDKDVIRVKSLVNNPDAKTILVKVKPGRTRKIKPDVPKVEKVESKRVQKEESEDEEEEEEQEVEETEDTTEIDTTESEMSDAPKSIRKINKRVKALKKVEQKLQAVTKNSVNPVNPYAQFLKW